ncbi:MAG: phosphoesterase [Sulfobacillus acidophilus]|uniref:Phosphoesterase n=1 Tax=Sulfobacillus acidophilus TaxID=53633 RepID=A0A2T2WEV9_9FIRM|nr:MAG: phosphoesterase [Sulfobacillus acidophilus]
MKGLGRAGAVTLIAIMLTCIGLYWYLRAEPNYPRPTAIGRMPHLRHVFVIMMENHSLDALTWRDAPYIRELIKHDGYDYSYFGVTHVSLPNYVALVSGSTQGTYSDNPNQRFFTPTLMAQLTRHHISWQGVMQSIPQAGYRGNWYPQPPGKNPVLMPINALYAKKHDPFMLFPAIARADGSHIVPLRRLTAELQSGHVPRLVWITPNLCSDMHGQPVGSRNCPSNHSQLLIRRGNRFLRKLVPEITRSRAFSGHSVIFITWDEAQMPRSFFNLGAWKRWLMPGPQSPTFLGVPIGGGSVPLIAIIPGKQQPPHVHLWADHYSLLKTIEAGFGLAFLGQAQSSRVVPLSVLVQAR